MQWLSEIITNLTVSRTTAGALFVATLLLLVLPLLFPGHIPSVPNQWQWLVLGLCIFSVSLLVFSCIHWIGSCLRKLPNHLHALRRQLPTTDLETAIIYLMGRDEPNGYVDVNKIYYSQLNCSKLDFLQACNALKSKGLLSTAPVCSHLIRLTERGRVVALDLLKQAEA